MPDPFAHAQEVLAALPAACAPDCRADAGAGHHKPECRPARPPYLPDEWRAYLLSRACAPAWLEAVQAAENYQNVRLATLHGDEARLEAAMSMAAALARARTVTQQELER